MILQLFRSALLGTAFGVLAASGAYAQGGGGELVVVANQEPQHMQAQVTYKEINSVGLRNVIEQLTRIDDNTGEVLPMLATSWKQVSPTVWHFKLREGITFHDGTPLDGEAAAVGINYAWSPDNDYDIRANMGPQITAEAVDKLTVAVITAAPDPLLAKRMYLGGISSAKQILEDPAGYDVHPIGTGPYVFDEWKQGQYVTMKANPDWWGNTAADTYGEIYFDSVRVVWRAEPIVRAAMVESGEAHIAMFLTREECERFNATDGIKCKGKGSDTFLQFRLDYHGGDPLLTDLDFRKAIFTAIDWEGIRQNLMGLGEKLHGQMLPSVATGFHEGIQQYPYDPAGAKAIVNKLKASGADMPSIHIATRLGSTPRNGEMVEAMGAMLDAVGIEAHPVLIEAGEDGSDLREDFPDNAFNHVILRVPLAEPAMRIPALVDGAVWLECTSPYAKTSVALNRPQVFQKQVTLALNLGGVKRNFAKNAVVTQANTEATGKVKKAKEEKKEKREAEERGEYQV